MSLYNQDDFDAIFSERDEVVEYEREEFERLSEEDDERAAFNDRLEMYRNEY